MQPNRPEEGTRHAAASGSHARGGGGGSDGGGVSRRVIILSLVLLVICAPIAFYGEVVYGTIYMFGAGVPGMAPLVILFVLAALNRLVAQRRRGVSAHIVEAKGRRACGVVDENVAGRAPQLGGRNPAFASGAVALPQV